MEPIQYITVACVRCNKKHKVLPKFIGRMTSCKRCKKKFELNPIIAVAKHEENDSSTINLDESTEFYIPISLTSSPMIDKEYERKSRAQTNFIKKVEKPKSKRGNLLVFAGVFLTISILATLAYVFLIR